MTEGAGQGPVQRLWCTAPDLWRPGGMRRILTLSGLVPRPLWPGLRPRPGDAIGLAGQDAPEPKALARAALPGLPLVRIAPVPLEALRARPQRRRSGGPGLLIDRTGGVHFDPGAPSAVESLLASHPLDDTALLDRAREGMARLADGSLSAETGTAPRPGHVLILDQPRGDAALIASGAGSGTLREMLFRAQDDHPGARIVIRPDPDTIAGLRPGHFTAGDAQGPVTLLTDPVSPQALLEGAVAVYTVSAPLGFDAILAGHRPQVFGRPFYAGWGLTEDHGGPMPRRHRPLTRAQLFAAAMILAPTWYDPCRDRLCRFEDALDQLEAELRAIRQDRAGHVATGMRLWKRGPLQGFFGREAPVIFADPPARAVARAQGTGRSLLVWAGQAGALPPGTPALRVEDGLIRSRGLGADLVPPLSLVADDLGIYYDPTRESRLERLIAAPLRPGQRARAERLVARLVAGGVTKYNLGGALPDLPPGHRILVPGQVEDDASILLGAGDTRTNLALLERVRAENPGAVILWKPHPDVEAGLRPGAVPPGRVAALADVTLTGVDAAAALAVADAVWTITSTLGFEALLRGVPVTCLGAPFYAGWGLTRDLGPVPARRQARPDVAALAHAALIAYPRYRDPISGRPCPAELVVDRIADGRVLPRSATLRILAAAQGALSGHAWLWRR
jgi:capsular polysaccharide export protein